VAAIVHLALVLLFALLLRSPTPQPELALAPAPERALAIDEHAAIDPADIAEILLPTELPPMVPGQVVPATGSHDDPPLEDTPYIAERDSNPDRQTRRFDPAFEAQPHQAARRAGATPSRPEGPRPDEPAAPPTATAATPSETTDRVVVAEDQVLSPPGERLETVPAGAGPTETGAPGGDNDEDLPALPAGEVTAIAARRSAMAVLLNSVRERVRTRWRAREIYPRLDPTGLFGDSSLITSVNVRMGADGRLERAQVVRGSGLAPMDLEAVAAFARADPFNAPPSAVLDGRGGVEFTMDMEFEVVVHRFRVRTRQRLREQWRPSPAFQRNGDHERVTTARVLVTPDGVLTRAAVISSAGIDFLDRGVLEALRAGLRLPRPPASYGAVSGLVPLWIEFHHNVRSTPVIKVLSPSERPRLTLTQDD
jgi:TonB family protein